MSGRINIRRTGYLRSGGVPRENRLVATGYRVDEPRTYMTAADQRALLAGTHMARRERCGVVEERGCIPASRWMALRE